jgi:hypothetical protein
MIRTVGRRAFVQSVVPAGAGAAFTPACGRVHGRPFGPLPPTAPASSTPLVQSGMPPAVAEGAGVHISADGVRCFLQETLTYREPYLATVRDQLGGAAAQQEADVIHVPRDERFSFDVLPDKDRHIITSWNRAQRLCTGAWIDNALAGDRRGWDPDMFYWDWFDWGTGGVYQKVKFDGHGFLLGVDFPDVDPRRT